MKFKPRYRYELDVIIDDEVVATLPMKQSELAFFIGEGLMGELFGLYFTPESTTFKTEIRTIQVGNINTIRVGEKDYDVVRFDLNMEDEDFYEKSKSAMEELGFEYYNK